MKTPNEDQASKRLIFHIGLRKAGSSTIQRFLHKNVNELSRLGIDYPDEGRHGRWSHLNIVADVRKLDRFDKYCGGVADLAAHWKALHFPFTIISSEAFEPTPRKDVEALKEALQPGPAQVLIAIVIRAPQSLIPSSYAESVSSGRKTLDFDALFERLIDMRRLQYFQTANRWALVWGWDSIRVRLLDRAHMLNGDLVDDLLNAIGFDVNDPRYKALPRPEAANVSPGWKVIEALRALYGDAHRLPADHPLVLAKRGVNEIRTIRSCASDVGATMGWNDERGVYLTRSQAERCADIFAKTTHELNSCLSVPVPEPDNATRGAIEERQFLPDASHIAPADLREFYDQLGARYVAARMDALRQPASAEIRIG